MSLLIRDAQIIDGKGKKSYKADVLIQKNIISAIGNLKSRGADSVIDGMGHYLVPGFIDTHTTADHYLSLFDNPQQSDFVNQGVTTTIGGHCSSSLAPLLYGTLESIRKWSSQPEININWHTFSEFSRVLEQKKLGVNFGTLAGHSTIRRAIAGDRARLQPIELTALKNILGQALDEGVFGLSVGLEYIHSGSAPQKELNELAREVCAADALYSIHLRDYGKGLPGAVKEAVDIAEKNGVRTLITHLMPIKGMEKEYEEALNIIEKSKAEIYFNLYPHPVSIKPIYTLLPKWAQVGNIDRILERVRDKNAVRLLKKDMDNINVEAIQIASAPKNEYMVGKFLKEIAENLNKTPLNALFDVMNVTALRSTVFYENINKDVLRNALMHEHAIITAYTNSSSSKEFIVHEESRHAFPRYITRARECGVSLENTIANITSKPAKLLRIQKRGVINEGGVADLVILNKADLDIKYVLIGGVVVNKKEHMGAILKHKQ